MNNQTDRQAEIILVALELINTKGIQGLTIKNISKEIGISEPAIYRHFASKSDILLGVLSNFKEMAIMLSEIVENYNATATEKLDFLFSRMLDLFTQTPSMVSVIFSEEIFKNNEMLKAKINETVTLQTKTIESIILQGQNENQIRTDIDERDLALLTMGSFRLLVKKWELNNHNFDLQKEGKKLIAMWRKILNKEL
ncbi:TetR/AcrR family transcriptional regulator [uncultured Draconibacterium sp.]|uniref:TetR/AcrR family transcriptional regulator n=1 Tax=uncultured Draconibacterium sp. TaxID=1573823 RepID=UPI003217B325